jgi:hypothetical protein
MSCVFTVMKVFSVVIFILEFLAFHDSLNLAPPAVLITP